MPNRLEITASCTGELNIRTWRANRFNTSSATPIGALRGSTTHGGFPSGSVTCMDGTTILATVPRTVVGGADRAVLTTAALPVGSDAITATYVNSDGNDVGSTASLTERVLGPGVYAVGATLWVVGADTNDTGSVSPLRIRTDGTTVLKITVTLNRVSTVSSFNQPFGAVAIYGDGGNDSIVLATSLTLSTTVVEGDGNDTVTASSGALVAALGNGNDTVTAGNALVPGTEDVPQSA
jgi:hypothetical protein